MSNEPSALTVFVALSSDQKRSDLEMAMMTNYLDISVFSMGSFPEFESRIKTDAPHLIITDANFLKGNSILKEATASAERASTSYIVFGEIEGKENYLDEMMLGKIQFFDGDLSEEGLRTAIKKAFKFSSESQSALFLTKILKANDHLMKEGDAADKVFILKKGKLQAYHAGPSGKTILGEVEPGDFVGEMAYFNSEPRSANVIAITDAELIEIPLSSFDRVIYQKPAWAMKLIETLTKRLKKYISAPTK